MIVVIVIVVIVTGGKQSQLLALALGLGWSLTKLREISLNIKSVLALKINNQIWQ